MRLPLRALSLASIVLTAAALPTTAAPPTAEACMILGGGNVNVAGEEVLIAWDPAHHTEHFVRHLSFRDATQAFGFIVPTPSRPQLADADDALFSALFGVYRYVPPPVNNPARSVSANGVSAAAEMPLRQVTEVEHRRVAGLDATVLSATDAQALAAWLTAHHYPSTPALAAYLAPYVQAHAFITAFRFDPSGGAVFGTHALRMTFQTDRPVFPYAEASDAPQVAGRVFRISVIAPARMEGRVGDHPWAELPRFAGHPSLAAVATHLPTGAVAPGAWLTTFQEDNTHRGRDDLYFVPAAEQRPAAGSLTTRIE